MWLSALEEVPANPPTVPYDTIGTVIVALIGAIVAVTVAVLQRTKNSATGAPAIPPVAPFTVPEDEWRTIRDRSVSNRTMIEDLASDVGKAQDALRHLENDIAHIKGSLGLP